MANTTTTTNLFDELMNNDLEEVKKKLNRVRKKQTSGLNDIPISENDLANVSDDELQLARKNMQALQDVDAQNTPEEFKKSSTKFKTPVDKIKKTVAKSATLNDTPTKLDQFERAKVFEPVLKKEEIRDNLLKRYSAKLKAPEVTTAYSAADDIDDVVLNSMNAESKAAQAVEAAEAARIFDKSELDRLGVALKADPTLIDKIKGFPKGFMQKLAGYGDDALKMATKAAPVLGAAGVGAEAANAVQNFDDVQTANNLDQTVDSGIKGLGATSGATSGAMMLAGNPAGLPVAMGTAGLMAAYHGGKALSDLMGGEYRPNLNPGSGAPPMVAPGQTAPPAEPVTVPPVLTDNTQPNNSVAKAAIQNSNISNVKAAAPTVEELAAKQMSEELGRTIASQENLQAAQDAANQQRATADLLRSLEVMGSGVAGLGSGQGPTKLTGQEMFKDQAARADQKVKDYKDLVANEDNDPASTASTSYRKFTKEMLQKAGMSPALVPENASKETLEKLFPIVSKMYDAKENRESREANAREGRLNRQALLDSKKETKKQEETDKYAERFQKQLRESGLSELGSALRDAEALIGDGFDTKKDIPGYGMATGVLPDFMVSEKGKQLRNAISNMRNVKLQKRSGAAITDSELARFMDEFGAGNFQTEASLKEGLKRLSKALKKDVELIESGYGRDVVDTVSDRLGDRPSNLVPNVKTAEDMKSNSNKPKTVIQNGHTYTLNEQTGQYE